MNNAVLLLIFSTKDIPVNFSRQWRLKEDTVYEVGRKNNLTTSVNGNLVSNSKPALETVDLSFDPAISRRHAEIRFESGYWQLKDTSAYGTKINGRKITKGENVKLQFDDEIILGNNTTVVIIPSNRIVRQLNDFWLEVEVTDTLNYALLHNSLPFVEKIILCRGGKDKSPSVKLSVELENYFEQIYEIPALSAGERFILKPEISIDPQRFETQTEASKSFLKIFLNESLAIEKEIRIFAYNEWSKEDNPCHRASLASFVLPNHPYIQQVIAETRDKLIPYCEARWDTYLYAEGAILYEYFQKEWKFEYVDEPLSFEIRNQRIRFPHTVLMDWPSRKAAGTCIDLSLLFASCLENSGSQPIVLIFKMKDKSNLCHAITGYWRNSSVTGREPLLNSKAQIKENAFIFDATGFTRGKDFGKATQDAEDILMNNELLFAVDIIAARDYNILPLPFCGQPKESPLAVKVDKTAKELAEKIGEQSAYKVYSPTHILLALLIAGDGFVREVFNKAGIDIEKAKLTLTQGLKDAKVEKQINELKPSKHYRAVWNLAQNLAKNEGSPFIFEHHLFLSLLEIESKALLKALISLGADKDSFKKNAYSLLKTQPFSEGEKSFFGSIC